MSRVSANDLKNSLSPINAKPLDKKNTYSFKGKKTQYFDKNGHSHPFLELADCLAKVEVLPNNCMYFIKFNRQTEPYNPFDKHYIENSIRFARKTGITEEYFRLISVNETAFNNYISFLQSQKVGYLNKVRSSI